MERLLSQKQEHKRVKIILGSGESFPLVCAGLAMGQLKMGVWEVLCMCEVTFFVKHWDLLRAGGPSPPHAGHDKHPSGGEHFHGISIQEEYNPSTHPTSVS